MVLGFKRWLPLVPGSLLAVLLGIAAVAVFGLDGRGVDIVGHIDSGLPSVGLPDGVGFDDYIDLLGPAVGVLLIGFAEGLGAAKTYAAKEGYEVDANRELLGLGTANLGSGLCSGMVVNGSLSKTAVNGGAGAKSQVSGLVVAVLTVVTCCSSPDCSRNSPRRRSPRWSSPPSSNSWTSPRCAVSTGVWTERLGSIYGYAARADFAAALAAMVGVLLFDTLPGLVIGIGVSMLLLLYRASRPHVAALAKEGSLWVDAERHPPDLPTTPHVVVVRVEAGLFFANADHVKDRIEDLCTDDTRVVVLDAETSPFIDVSAAQMLVQLRDVLARRGIELRVARDIGQFRDAIRHSGSDSTPVDLYPTVREALAEPDRQ